HHGAQGGAMTEPREIFDCARVRGFLESYLQGQVPPPERRAMRLHIHACADCHARVLASDPLQIFAPLADEEKDDAFSAGFWPAVRADIHAAEDASRSWPVRLARPALAWAASAALLVLVASALLHSRPGAGTPRDASGDASIARTAAEGWRGVLPGAGTVG